MNVKPTGRPRKYPTLQGPFNDLIQKRMEQLGHQKLEEFADYAGIGRSSIFQLVRGRMSQNGNWTKPSLDQIVKLAVALDVPTHELIYRVEPDAPGFEQIQHITPDMVRVHVAGYVGAGPGQNHALDDEYVAVNQRFALGKQLVAYKVRGDSMAGGKRPIYDGDTVIVDTLDPGMNGQIVVARLEDDWFVCKALKEDKFGKALTSLNPLYTNSAPAIISADKVQGIVGRVVRVIQDVEPINF